MTVAPERVDGDAKVSPSRTAIDFEYLVARYWPSAVSALIVGLASAFIFFQLEPGLVFRDTTAAGGDMGAHVWYPAFLRDHLLPWRLSGWSMDFYMGFPAGQFYFPLPALAIVFLDVLTPLPYNVAFKLVVISGPVMLPAAAYTFLRGIRVPRPAPELGAIAITFYLFFRGLAAGAEDPAVRGVQQALAFAHQVMGGNLASTLAGEYSFTIALAFSLFFLGALGFALDRRVSLAVPAVLFAATLLSHVIVAVFAAVAAVIVVCVRLARDGRQPQGAVAAGVVVVAIALALYIETLLGFAVAGAAIVAALGWFVLSDRSRVVALAAATGATGALLAGVWLLPLAANLGLTTNMRYEKIGSDPNVDLIRDYLFTPQHTSYHWLAVFGLVVGIIATIGSRVGRPWPDRFGTLAVGAIALIAGIGFVRWPEGHVWNLRFLPFWYISVYFLAAIGVAELCRLPGAALRWFGIDAPEEQRSTTRAAGTLVEYDRFAIAITRYGAMVLATIISIAALVGISVDNSRTGGESPSYLPYWASYNFGGFEDTRPEIAQKSFPEYESVIRAFDDLPQGPVLWEVADDANGAETIGQYGTPFALMLLPYWTEGDHQSLLGLYFEASGTTPYVFMNQSRLARNSKGTVRSLPYSSYASDYTTGIDQARLLGVRYYMTQTSELAAFADADPRLTFVKEIPDVDGKDPLGWRIYEINDWGTVQPLANEPIVVPVEGGNAGECFGESRVSSTQVDDVIEPWLCVAGPWFDTAGALDRPLTDGGLDSWARAEPGDAIVAERTPLPEVEVTDVVVEQDRVSFRVSETGVPVYIAVSYYPNWTASGAEGPWRATPNGMVVVPTSNEVVLEFSRTGIEWLGFVATLLGLVGVFGLVRWKWPYDPAAPEPEDDGIGDPPTRLPVQRVGDVGLATSAKTPDVDVGTEGTGDVAD